MYHKTDDREEGQIVDCRDREKCRVLVEYAKKDDNILGEEAWISCPNLPLPAQCLGDVEKVKEK